MKNHPFHRRLGFALHGLLVAAKGERSFQTQLVAAAAALTFLGYFRAPPMWWAIFLLAIGSVLALELINTALEHLIDHLHPERHPKIGLVKDCAAGGVLLMSLVSVGVLLAFICTLI